MKNLTLQLTLLTLIAGTALAPKPMYGMNEQTNVIGETKEQLNQKLLSAAKSGDIETVKNCLDSGAHLNTQNIYGNTPLIYACISGHKNIVQYLVENGANLNTQDKYGNTPLIWACINGNTNIAQYLVENGANLNTQDKLGTTALIMSCDCGHTDIVQYLVEHGAHLYTQDNDGYTPLMYACNKEHTDIVQYLIKNGANLYTQNNNNQTAYDIAVQEGRQRTAQYLVDVQNELNNFKINPLQPTIFAPKSAFIKMLYKANKYTDLCYIVAKFKESNNHNELKTMLDECTFLQCSKEEIKKLNKSRSTLNSQKLIMQENFIVTTQVI